VSGGFANPIIGGGGALVYPSIHSPNFNVANPMASPSPSWAILKNGLAYFFGLVLSGGTVTGPDYIINTAGIFIYSGAPAAGNLLISLAGASGNDQFGNPFFQGLTVYGPTGAAIQLEDNGSQAAMTLTPAGVTHLSIAPQIIAGSVNTGLVNEIIELAILSGKANGNADAGIQLISAPADASALALAFFEFGGAAEVFIAPGFGIRAAQPSGGGAIEGWHAMALSSGWTLGASGYAEYKKMPDNTVMIRGYNLVPGTLTNGTHLWTIPAGYVPSKAAQPITAIVRSGTAIGTIPRLEAVSTGTVNIQDFQTTASSLYFSGSYALD
jgi:hypothetical protein